MLEPSAQAEQRLSDYESKTSLLMVVLALAYLGLFAAQVLWLSLPAGAAYALTIAGNLIWVSFALDLIIRTYLAPNRIKFLIRNPIDVIAVVLPVFRNLRVLRVLTAGQWLISRGANLAVGRALAAVVAAGAFMWVLGSLAVLDAERGAPGSNITTFGDALWWAATTMSTVGYGDEYPITTNGRLVAVGMMVVGVSMLGLVSATLAAGFMARIQGVEKQDTDKVLDVLARIEAHLSEAPATAPTDGATSMGHDPFCSDRSIAGNGECSSCEQVRLVREDTALHIRKELETRMQGVPQQVASVLEEWTRKA